MDTFWNLSSDDTVARAKAGQALIEHCFGAAASPKSSNGDDSDSSPLEDVKYALGRLIKGTCTGRASSRQGYASTLVVFLKRLFESKSLTEKVVADDSASSPLTALYAILTKTTLPPPSATKGTELRDYQFGLLFSLLSIARSGVLAAATAAEATVYVTAGVELYNTKKWMRESAVSAIIAVYESLDDKVKKAVKSDAINKLLKTEMTVELLTLKLALEPECLTSNLLSTSLSLLMGTTASFPRLHSVWPTLLPLLTPSLLETLSTAVLAPLASSTHERKSLPLLLLPTLLASPTVTPAHIPHIMTPAVTRLLLNAGSKDTKNPHLLQPLASQTIKAMRDVLTGPNFPADIRLTVAAALLKADAKFDAKTRSDIVGTVLSNLTEAGQMQYVDFLIGEIMEVAKITDDAKRTVKSTAAVDALLGAARMFLPKPAAFDPENKTADKTAETSRLTPVMEKIYAFMMAGAFFDCAAVEAPLPPAPEKTPSKKGKKTPTKKAAPPPAPSSIIAPALSLAASTPLQYSLRSPLAGAFFSILSDLTVSCFQISTSNDVMRATHKMWLELEQAGGVLKREALGDEEMKSRVQVSEVCEKDLTAVANLAMCLGLQLLNEGKDESSSNAMAMLDEEDNVDSEVTSAIHDLVTGAASLMKAKFESIDADDALSADDDALAVVADVCVGVLAMGTNAGPSRGGSVRALREAVKRCWGGILGSIEGDISQAACKVLLESVCGAEDDEDEDEDEEDADMEDADEDGENDSDEMELDGNAFSQLNAQENNEDDESDDENDDSDSDSDSDESVEVNPEALSSMLLDDADENNSDDDSDDDDDALLHHEGADGALAHMIKTSQATRKKGKQQLEQLDVDHKIRCLSLLEAILNKNKLGDNTFDVVMPLLNLHKSLTNATTANHKLSATGVVASKKSMLEKLTKLFTTRIVKAKGGSGAADLFKSLVEEAGKSPSREHASCVSLALIACMKADGSIEGVEGAYADLAEDWASKKTSKVHALMFEDLLTREVSGAAAILTKPMVRFMNEGRSDFIKSECFRIAAKILESPNKDVEVDAEKICVACKESLSSGLKNKRVKDVLSCVSALVAYGKRAEKKSKFWKLVESELVDGLKKVGSDEKVSGTMGKIANQAVADIAENSLVCGEEEEEVKKAPASEKKKKGKTPVKKGKK
jgi:hypothetical protein